ncbi:HAMP domain-containing protein [Streptomyces sp. NPDC029006]|uniref:HAMP domain-containing protein n=1 Tax=Streptomyces sp. NPDC029006 TaxID=3155467 RepID=UPI003410FD77
MIALSFLVPLCLLVQTKVRDNAITQAQQRASALAPVLAITTRPSDVQQAVDSFNANEGLGVHLPDGRLIGTSHTSASTWQRSARQRLTFSVDTGAGWHYLQPVVLPGDQTAVVEAFVSRDDLTQGVTTSWVLMSLLALGLVLGSVGVADRLGTRVVRSVKDLSHAAHIFGQGHLRERVDPGGPAEMAEAGAAFNAMADRVVELLAYGAGARRRSLASSENTTDSSPPRVRTAVHPPAHAGGGAPGRCDQLSRVRTKTVSYVVRRR